VDLSVAFQRDLRETEALIVMIELQREHPIMDIRNFREATLPAANDNRIDLWINGMREPVLLLMKQRVPCFIVHKFPLETLEPISAVPNPPTFYDFVASTDVIYLVCHSKYQLLAEGQGCLNAIFRAEDGRGEHIQTQPQDEACSASAYLTSLAPWTPCARPHQAHMTASRGGPRRLTGVLATSAAPVESSGKEDSDENNASDKEDSGMAGV
jgi:hypothetical protein